MNNDELDRVPRYVLASRVREFIASLGFDLSDMSQSGIHIGWPSITADIHARNRSGSMYVDSTTGSVAMHHIHIPIIEDGEA